MRPADLRPQFFLGLPFLVVPRRFPVVLVLTVSVRRRFSVGFAEKKTVRREAVSPVDRLGAETCFRIVPLTNCEA